jgi:hypothetical protein
LNDKYHYKGGEQHADVIMVVTKKTDRYVWDQDANKTGFWIVHD